MSVNPNGSQEEKNAHYRSVLRAYADGVCREDLDAIRALFAENAEVEDPVGEQHQRFGKAAIRTFYESVVARHVRVKVTGPICGSKGNAAVMPIHVEVLGTHIDCISVARFNDQGLIEKYMAHWGPGDVTAANKAPS